MLAELIDFLDAVAGRRPRKNHRELPNVDELPDIGGIPIDHFWLKVEEFLPDDWAFGLFAFPDQDGQIRYRAIAELIDHDMEDPPGFDIIRTTPERAIETLFYCLRDML